MMEVFKPISGEPGYEVSDMGRVMRDGRIIKGSKAGIGYRKIIFVSGAHRYVHHLVLETFAEERPEGYEACHLNGIRDDNRLSNLMWGTRKENHSHKNAHGTAMVGEKHWNAKLTSAQAKKIRWLLDKGLGGKYLARRFGVSPMTISRIKNNKAWRDSEAEADRILRRKIAEKEAV